MQFGDPVPWRPEWTKALKSRFTPITIGALAHKGACHYAWVRPDEPELRNLDPPKSLKHGGFAYLFHQDLSGTHPSDRVFPLKQFSPAFMRMMTKKRMSVMNDEDVFSFVNNIQ